MTAGGLRWARSRNRQVTIRLTPLDAGTLVELFHHGFEVLGADAAENHRGFEGGWTMRQLDALHELLGS